MPLLVWVVLLFVFQSSPRSQTTLEYPFKKKYVDLYLKILDERYVALQTLRIKETYSKIKIFTFKSQPKSLFSIFPTHISVLGNVGLNSPAT